MKKLIFLLVLAVCAGLVMAVAAPAHPLWVLTLDAALSEYGIAEAVSVTPDMVPAMTKFQQERQAGNVEAMDMLMVAMPSERVGFAHTYKNRGLGFSSQETSFYLIL